MVLAMSNPLNQLFLRILEAQRKAILDEPRTLLSDARPPREAGTYILFQRDELVYAGKAWNLHDRIRDHVRKLQRADLIDLAEIECQYLTECRPLALAEEQYLIDHFKPKWNCDPNWTGFGNHAGQNRGHESKWHAAHGLETT